MAGPLGRRAHVLGAEPDRAAVGGRDGRRRASEALRARHVPVPERRAVSTSGTRSATSAPTCTRGSCACRATTCSTRWATTRSGSRPSSPPSRPAVIRGRPPTPTWPPCAASCGRSGSATTPGAASPPPIRSTTGGRSGSSCGSSTRGSTTSSSARARSPSSSPRSSRVSLRPTATRIPTACHGPISTRPTRRAVVDSYRLAYLEEATVNWCPALGTVLANEEVTSDGRSERGNHPVFRRPLKQWKLRITAYTDRLLDDLVLLDWPESIKTMQRNWIGKSTGALAVFDVQEHDGLAIEVFTTRPDTLVRRDLHGARARAPVARRDRADRVARRHARPGPRRHARRVEGDLRRRRAAVGRGAQVPRVRGAEERARAPGRGPRQDGRVHRGVRDESHQRRVDPDLRRRLRAHGLRHRGDHGRARRTTSATSSSRRSSSCRS